MNLSFFGNLFYAMKHLFLLVHFLVLHQPESDVSVLFWEITSFEKASNESSLVLFGEPPMNLLSFSVVFFILFLKKNI